MEEDIDESILTGYPNEIPYESTKKIISQMEKNVCKIKINNKQGTGFFCKIPFPNKDIMLPVFITNNHLINEKLLYKEDEKISIFIEEQNSKKIDLKNRIKYTNEEYDITIIEIKDEDEINNYLELDDTIIEYLINDNNKNGRYLDETVYIIQYPEGKLSVSYGVLDNIYEDKKYSFNHKCCTKGGSSGSSILNINNNKVLGIHKKGYNKKYNIGTFLNYSIKKFIEQNKNKYTSYKQKIFKENIKKNENNNINQKIKKINDLDSNINKLNSKTENLNSTNLKDKQDIKSLNIQIGQNIINNEQKINEFINESNALKNIFQGKGNLKIIEKEKSFQKVKITILNNLKLQEENIKLRKKVTSLEDFGIRYNTKKGEGDYDVVLCVDSLKNLTKLGWVIKYNKKEGKDIYEKSKQSKTVIVGVLGNANKGKSFLLRKI